MAVMFAEKYLKDGHLKKGGQAAVEDTP